MIDTAMILAAGRGERMRPLTDAMPKPLIPVAGKPMLEHTLARLKAHGVVNIVVNAHHFAEQIVDQVKGRARIIVEDRLLNTGGSVKNALPLLGNGPFFVLNGDSLWRDGPEDPTLKRMEDRWGVERMDALLLLHPLHKVIGREPKDRGDYFIEPRGRLRHRGQAPLSPYVFASVSICHPRLFRDSPHGPFSLLQLWHRAEAEGRLHGMIHDGDWFHIGTPQALAAAERVLAERALAEGVPG
jgi:N-acetyl-alpha-D-muramate 1-phosphate uridylyltransferase